MNLNYLDIPIHEDIVDSEYLSELQKKILTNRLPKGANPKDYYYTTLDYLSTIDDLPDIDKAVKKIEEVMSNNGHIVLFSDYDCDGITSAATLTKGFKDFLKYDNITTIVNKRIYGNGFNKHILDKLIVDQNFTTKGIDLIITSDHGSANAKEITYLLKEQNIPTIITDHHIVPENDYPNDAIALINPHRSDSEYYHDISGCYVAFLLIAALYSSKHGDDKIEDLSPLLSYVGISTISDMMTLKQPLNRLSVTYGLREINKMNDKRWMIIKKVLDINTTVNYNNVGFKIAPLINTGNRMSGEEIAFTLLTSDDETELLQAADRLQTLNRMRKKVQKDVARDALTEALRVPTEYSQIIPIHTEANIAGVIANQLGDRFHKTTICIVPGEITSKGSARAILPGVNIDHMFNYIKERDPDIIVKAGGHEGAGGIEFYTEKLKDLQQLVEEYVANNRIDEIHNIPIDVIINADDITPELIHELKMLEPYGKDWEEPIFKSTMRIHSTFMMGNICRVMFKTKHDIIEGVYFGDSRSNTTPTDCGLLRSDDIVHVVFTLGLSDYNRSIKTELKIIDIGKEIVNESTTTFRDN